MKTITLHLITIALVVHCSTAESKKAKRGSFEEFPVGSYSASGSGPSGIDEFLPISGINTDNVRLKVSLPSANQQYGTRFQLDDVSPIVSNSLDKPVSEAQEYIPPTSYGTAIIPQVPPPATPVNAVAANVPATAGAVFLGSGSLGVVDLGNGAYALGSGSIGYSDMRSNPRPSSRSPLYPPVRAAPNLIPAAVPSSIPPPSNPLPSYQPTSVPVDYDSPFVNYLNPAPPKDPNGYEYLPPNRVGFGSPIPRLPRVKSTMSFATPTALQVQQPQYLQPQPPPSYQFFTSPGQDTSSQTISFGQKLPSF